MPADPIITPEVTMALVRLFMRMKVEDKDTAVISAREVIKPLVTDGGTNIYSGALSYSVRKPQPVIYGFPDAGDPGVEPNPPHADHVHALDPTVGGDLSGSLPDPTVAKINGIAITNSPASADDMLVITNLSPLEAEWQPGIVAHEAASDPHPVYATDADLVAHEAASDPHPGYVTPAEFTPLLSALFTAKGDILAGTGAGTFTRLAAPASNGYFLVTDPLETTGLKWIARTPEMATIVLDGTDNVLNGTDRVIQE